MKASTIQAINEETKRFYATFAASFSATRSRPWQGWARLPELMADPTECVWDLGCGNLRFERFLEEEFPDRAFSVEAWDACVEMVGADPVDEHVRVGFRELDIVGSLLAGQLPAPPAPVDLAVSFGLFHHVPSRDLRAALLRRMCEGTRPGGLVAISLWNPIVEERAAEKAAELTPLAQAKLGIDDLEPGDCFLNWQDDRETFRFCHCFTEEEALGLAESAADLARLEAFYQADGKSGIANTYLCLRVR